ncbi:MAG: cysteine--tRNA ligase, partial [Lentisphaerae bacterium]|nr:cysteine--tRNA ligase [Lentisphaerota bacterium]
EHYPPATEHIDDMISLIKRLFDAGYAYKSNDGSVYFDIGKFKDYGKLAHLDKSGMRAGARVNQDEYDKENVVDFALWKAWSEEDGDVAWDSPWGKGRPGWHIECSAMSTRYLGESFDLHTGGIDNMFPHHENEIAQTEAATGKQFVKYWMHCGYLVVDGRKMSKSLGNFHTLREIIEKGYSGREVRYVLLSAHYRQELNFTFQALDAARAALARLDEFSARLSGDAPRDNNIPGWCSESREKFRSALDNDLNMPEALSALFEMVHQGNKAIDTEQISPDATAHASAVLADFDQVLGFLGTVQEKPDATVRELVELRRKARQSKDWSESDRIRGKIAALGWEVRDTAEGIQLRRLNSVR